MFRPRYTIAWSMVAIAVIGYFCAFPELAVLLGIFASALLFVSPVAVLIYFTCRGSFRASTGEPPALAKPQAAPAGGDEPPPGPPPSPPRRWLLVFPRGSPGPVV